MDEARLRRVISAVEAANPDLPPGRAAKIVLLVVQLTKRPKNVRIHNEPR